MVFNKLFGGLVNIAKLFWQKTLDSLIGWAGSTFILALILASAVTSFPNEYALAEAAVLQLIDDAAKQVGEVTVYSLSAMICGAIILVGLWARHRRCQVLLANQKLKNREQVLAHKAYEEERKAYEKERELLIQSFGVAYFSHRNVAGEHNNDWDVFLELVEAENPGTLRIIGASGVETFCRDDGPLHQLVINFPGEVRALLLKPGSEAVKARATSLGCAHPTYSKEIKESIDFLVSLQSRSRVSIKTYEHLPNWKIVMTDENLWLQYYMPGNHVTDCSAYIIYKNSDNSSLYSLFSHQFTRAWEAGELVSQ